MTAYYNEIDPYCAQWLRNLIQQNLIAPGVVDERDIRDVKPYELKPYTQCHFFAGIGGWSYALRLAGVADHREVWTGSCPCQPFSAAGKRLGFADDRHLWPYWRYLIEQCGPPAILGEQVASASEWLKLVRSDLEEMDYAVGCMPVEAASAGADHLRDRYWFVAECSQQQHGRRSTGASGRIEYTNGCGLEYAASVGWGEGRPEHEVRSRGHTAAESGSTFNLADADAAGSQGRRILSERTDQRFVRTSSMGDLANSNFNGASARRIDFSEMLGFSETQRESEFGPALFGGSRDGRASEQGGDFEWVIGADGKARRVKPGICLLAHGIPARVAKLRAFGNAIVPQVAAEFIKAALIEEPIST
jgi:DNA (cytosine-5)-methyltransferase 1